jgi:hypothetical protein
LKILEHSDSDVNVYKLITPKFRDISIQMGTARKLTLKPRISATLYPISMVTASKFAKFFEEFLGLIFVKNFINLHPIISQILVAMEIFLVSINLPVTTTNNFAKGTIEPTIVVKEKKSNKHTNFFTKLNRREGDSTGRRN